MYRSSKRNGSKSYSTGVVPRYLDTSNPSVLVAQTIERRKCEAIDEQKNKLLTSLSNYFAREIDKEEVKVELRNIKKTLAADCPTYVQTNSNLCC